MLFFSHFPLDKISLSGYNIVMPILSPERTYNKTISKTDPEVNLDYKTSELANNLINVISEIIAMEYVVTVRNNPEVFTDNGAKP